MKFNKTSLVGILLVSLSYGGSLQAAEQRRQSISDSRQEASRLLEKAVAAKGGRERLRSVKNVLFIHGSGSYRSLMAFPGKEWEWADNRQNKIGSLDVTMTNCELNISYLSYASEAQARRIAPPDGALPDNYVRNTLAFLVEPQGIDLEPIGVLKERVNGKVLDVIQAEFRGERIGFALDPETNLPSAFFRYLSTGKPYHLVLMKDYALVDGIWMPSKVSFGGAAYLPSTFEINLDIDEQFFEKPPNVAAGPDAFRLRGQTPKPSPAQPVSSSTRGIEEWINELMQEGDAETEEAIGELTRQGRAAIVPLEKAFATAKSSNARINVARALLGIDSGHEGALGVLERLVADSRAEPRARLGAALVLSTTAPGIRVLTRLLGHPDAGVRRVSVFAFDERTESLSGASPEVQSAIRGAIPALKAATKDADEVVQGMAEEILEQLQHNRR